MFTLWRCWYSGCSHTLTHMHIAQTLQMLQTQMKYKHTEVQAQCTQCDVLWCAARRVRAYWIHLCCLQLLVCAHQPGQTFLSSCQHHLRQNNHHLITLTKPFSCIYCTLNFLIIHTHAQSSLSSAHMSRAPITFWRQLGAGTLVAAFRMKVISANGHFGSSPLQRRMLEHVVFLLQMKFYICFAVVCWWIGDLGHNLEGQSISDGRANMYHEWDCWGQLMIEHDQFCLVFFLCLFMFLRERHWI